MKLDTINVILVAIILAAVGQAAQAVPPECNNDCRLRKKHWFTPVTCNYLLIPDCFYCTGSRGVCLKSDAPLAGSCQVKTAGPNQEAVAYTCNALCAPAELVLEGSGADQTGTIDQGVRPYECR